MTAYVACKSHDGTARPSVPDRTGPLGPWVHFQPFPKKNEIMWGIRTCAFEINVVYDQSHYFGIGPIPKLKPKLADTFGRYCN